jgi:hypothetical protein
MVMVSASARQTPDGFQDVRACTVDEAVAQFAADAMVIAGGRRPDSAMTRTQGEMRPGECPQSR